MAELADALASGASDRKVVWVQVPPSAPKHIKKNTYTNGDTAEGVLLDLSVLREVNHLSFFLTKKSSQFN